MFRLCITLLEHGNRILQCLAELFDKIPGFKLFLGTPADHTCDKYETALRCYTIGITTRPLPTRGIKVLHLTSLKTMSLADDPQKF